MGTSHSIRAEAETNTIDENTNFNIHIKKSKETMDLGSSLDTKIINAMKELKRRKNNETHDAINPFNKIMLKFPSVASAFKSSRGTFCHFDRNHDGRINHKDLEEALNQLGGNFSNDEINEYFHESDMMEDGYLNFKEFLVCLAIGFVLHRIPKLEEGNSIFYAKLNQQCSPTERKQSVLFGEGNNLRIAFQLAIDAFLWFDVSGDGVIRRDEMAAQLQAAMHTSSPTKSMSKHVRQSRSKAEVMSANPINSFVSDRRFNEMDWDHNGTITFKEFLLAFESWVGLDDDEALELEQEDDENRIRTSQASLP